MENWAEIKLGSACTIKKGVQFNRLDMEEVGDFPCINGGIMPSGYTNIYNTDANTITISEGGNSCGYINFIKNKFWNGGHSYSLIGIKNNIDKNFLYYALKARENSIMDLRVGSGLPNIQQKAIKEFKFIYPISKKEQQKIAKILSTVDDTIIQTENTIAKYNRISIGLMQDLLTKGIDKMGKIRTEKTHIFKDSQIGRIPKEWDLKPLGKIAEFNSGYAFRSDQLTETGYKIVRISNLHKPNFPYWRYSGPVKENWIAKDGDVLFTWAGVATSIDCIKYRGENVLLNQHIYNFIFKNDIIKHFTYKYLQSYLPKLRLEIEGGAGQLHLTKDKIQSINIPIMIDSEMILINENFSQIDKTIEILNKKLLKLNKIKIGLMDDLLSGKKRVTD